MATLLLKLNCTLTLYMLGVFAPGYVKVTPFIFMIALVELFTPAKRVGFGNLNWTTEASMV
jgi:hypothetical protein